jgi:hypothetical protein
MIAAYAWLAGGEIPSQRLRSYTFGIASAVGFAGAWLATFTAPYFINPDSLNWGPEYGRLLAVNFLLLLLTPGQAGSGGHPASSPSLGCTSTFPRSRTARSKRSMRCSKRDCQRGSSGCTFVLDDMWWRRMRRACDAGRVAVRRSRWRGRKLLVLRRRVDWLSKEDLPDTG